ncbi:MAG: aspartate kinase, partial [Planctomycetota bacterium]|nr:aspartate kinase [Planctomycetota bacterium]
MKSAKRQPTRTISVHKFGGAALANAQAIESVVELITHTSGMRIIVTSALAGVTDVLLSVARAAASGDLVLAHTDARLLHERHLRVIELIDPSDAPLRQYIDESFAQLAELLVSVAHEKTLSARMSDAIISRGERIAAQIVACALRATGVCAAVVDAADFLQTDGRFGDAAPDLVRTEIFCAPLFSPILARGEIVVVPGFIGAGKENSVVTLGRGGSDLTATVIARVLAATEVTLWKDVRGFLTADPRIVPEARIVAQLDPREASELAYYGAKVLHPRALIPLTLGTTLRIRPFADPDAVGTEIARLKAWRS